MVSLRGGVFVLACLAGLGCDVDVSQDEASQTATTIGEGSSEARALLAFLNDPTVDAAAIKAGGATTPTSKAIALHRDGADAIAGTDDDDLFDSVKEVDDVPGVGPATLQKLAARAAILGYGSARGEYLGVYFTENQAARTLALVNEATADELDDDAFLDARAAANIVAARPITSLGALASISRVKASALRLLRDHADRTRAAPTCDASVPCAGDLWCTGGTSSPGRCVDTATTAWMTDEFVSESAGSIPDGPTGSTGVGVTVFGLATVPTSAVVRVVIDHPRPADLELTLQNPIGTTVLVWARGSGAVPESIPVVVPGDESANGDWVLTALDTAQGATGTLGRFSLELATRFD